MEEGVVSELLRSPLGEVFDHQQLITDVSGSGNNWLAIIIVHKLLCTESTYRELQLALPVNFWGIEIVCRYNNYFEKVDCSMSH